MSDACHIIYNGTPVSYGNPLPITLPNGLPASALVSPTGLDHDTLGNLNFAASSQTYGHINASAQTIAGIKTLSIAASAGIDNYPLIITNPTTITDARAGVRFMVNGLDSAGAAIQSINNGGTGGNLNFITRTLSADTTRVSIKAGTGETSFENNNITSIAMVSAASATFSGGVTAVGFHNSGSHTVFYRGITALRNLDATDYFVDCTANTFTVTLPTAASIAGRVYIIKNSGTGAITIATTGGQTIDGQSTMLLGVQYESLAVVSDGSNWKVV